MPLYVQQQDFFLGDTKNFIFPGQIQFGGYVVGLSHFSLNYTYPTGYNVRRLGVSLAHGQKDENTIYVTFNGYIEDDNGHSADAQAQCTAIVIAWVGSSDTATLAMQNVKGVSSSNSPQLTTPPNTVQVSAFLSGLQVELPAERGVTSFSAQASVNSGSSVVNIAGNSMLNGVEGTVDVGVLFQISESPPFQLFTQNANQGDANSLTLNFSPAISAAGTALISFYANFGGGPVNLMHANVSLNCVSFPTQSIRIQDLSAPWSAEIVGPGGNTTVSTTYAFNALVLGLTVPS